MPFEPQIGRVVLERGDGAAELVFARSGSASRLAHLFQRTPCRVLFPRPEPGAPPVAVLLTTSGGLTGGDRLRLDIGVRDNAAATVVSQAAEKIYRSLGPECQIQVNVEVEQAWLEWLPQETILFNGARLRRQTAVRVAEGGRFLGCEMVVFGRRAHGESFAAGFLHDAWRVHRADRLVWADALRLEDDVARIRAGPATLNGAEAMATVIYLAGNAADFLDIARSFLLEQGIRAAVSVVNGVLLARLLGDAVPVRHAMTGYLANMRQSAGGLLPRLPRVW
jgi:urease accessory protein